MGGEKEGNSPPPEGCQAQPDGVVAGTKGMPISSVPADTNHPTPAGHPRVGGGKGRAFPYGLGGPDTPKGAKDWAIVSNTA
jgi:hypothetical protein